MELTASGTTAATCAPASYCDRALPMLLASQLLAYCGFDQDEVNRRGVEPLLLVERGLDWPADVEVRAVFALVGYALGVALPGLLDGREVLIVDVFRSAHGMI